MLHAWKTLKLQYNCKTIFDERNYGHELTLCTTRNSWFVTLLTHNEAQHFYDKFSRSISYAVRFGRMILCLYIKIYVFDYIRPN